ncbi:MAG: hypothetical protein AB7F66_01450 [Bacteriovoracia bacterium]
MKKLFGVVLVVAIPMFSAPWQNVLAAESPRAAPHKAGTKAATAARSQILEEEEVTYFQHEITADASSVARLYDSSLSFELGTGYNYAFDSNWQLATSFLFGYNAYRTDLRLSIGPRYNFGTSDLREALYVSIMIGGTTTSFSETTSYAAFKRSYGTFTALVGKRFLLVGEHVVYNPYLLITKNTNDSLYDYRLVIFSLSFIF